MKDYYEKECGRVCSAFAKKDFSFAAVADSHLDNSLSDTLDNIRAVDRNLKFDCLVHLGDFMNGNLSESYTKTILNEQIESWRGAVSTAFYPAQGNHDGFFSGGTYDMATDELWYGATGYLDKDEKVSRSCGKPYFYVDFGDRKIRLVFVCSFHYDMNGEKFVKKYGISDEQIGWLKNDGFNAPCGWTVMVFSHDVPYADYFAPIGEDNQKINGFAAYSALKELSAKNGFDVAAWFVGHEHGDYNANIGGINFVMTACETAYVPSLWDMPGGGVFPERKLGTVSEDAWDAVSLDFKERKIRIVRFGAGKDRVISY